MKCPTCGAWTLVKQTTKSPTFGYTRRRECANEHRFTTQELVIPQEAIDYERRTHLENIRKRLESIQTRKPKRVRKSNARIY